MSLHLIKSNAIFFHIPKTGGTWVHKALENSGVKIETYYPNGHPHNTYKEESIEEKYLFAFVRHPFSWYKSYWAYRMKTGWETEWWLDSYCKSTDFEEFIRNIVNKQYCYLTDLYNQYIGKPAILNFVGKQENLTNDLIWVLNFLNEKFDEKKLRNTSKQNVIKLNPICSNELKQKLLELEKEIIRKFRYE